MGKMRYKISSRATILLGRESVSKVDSAIIELVKNTYDADAELCYISFDVANNSIYILDNGVGMTKEIIEDCWMMIGTDNKREHYKSRKNRIKSGEKGIGRFALDRLGSKCEMFTKNQNEKLIIWKNDWSMFEERGKTIDQIEADFEYDVRNFIDIIPKSIRTNIEMLEEGKAFNLETGTLLKISDLRDEWNLKKIEKIIDSLGYLIPPSQQKEYLLCVQKSMDRSAEIIENKISEEYDYRISAEFTGDIFKISLSRNEFDINRLPPDLFEMDEFKIFPYTYKEFEGKEIEYEYKISELMRNKNENYVNRVKELGEFKFDYTFMKLAVSDTDKKSYFYKSISKNRKEWMNLHSGIKIYRDNFLVRPYGDPTSDSFDWLGIDTRRVANPASVSHPSGNWRVGHRQSQGTLRISRIENDNIIDKSSREGLIENEHFQLLKEVIINIINLFENDRAYIVRNIKKYDDKVNKKEKRRLEGSQIAKEIISEHAKKNVYKKINVDESKENNASQSYETNSEDKKRVEKLAMAVQSYEEEREELMSELKLLRRLATNGLITSSIVHDLKSIKATFVNRVDSIEYLIEHQEEDLLKRSLSDLKNADEFLKSWITVSTHQKNDKRRRPKHNLYEVVKNTINLIEPILNQKNITINVIKDDKEAFKKVYTSDFESIIYNLIINSVESFERDKRGNRNINLFLKTEADFIIHYEDNGSGLSKAFKNPYDIFRYGVTSKYDKDGKPVGTGLGMYIVESTLREYNAKYKIMKSELGFGIELRFPI
ncbi:ATP-binding protein [Bacillus sp. S56]|uniref:sensor histidine kinase n=1 Tax=Bacillus sp. S56 TaxID=1226987 RepID=UPI00190BB6D6|nr:ATP-binding protein [Bacillus sp. S56]MBK0075546.1 sensor histidine kinase [Bacillus sp. S56]